LADVYGFVWEALALGEQVSGGPFNPAMGIMVNGLAAVLQEGRVYLGAL